MRSAHHDRIARPRPHQRAHDVPRADRDNRGGHALEPQLRSTLEPLFKHSFADVRVHADAHAAASADAIGALAYTVGENVVFGTGQYAPNDARGMRTLAHELTHVVQNARHPRAGAGAITETSDAAEHEARSASQQVARGESVDVAAAPTAAVAPLFGWVEDAADWVGDKVSDAGSAVAGAAGTAWGGIKDAGSYVYDGMKQNAAYIREGVDWAEDGIGWLEDKATGGIDWAADQVKDVPILGDVAQGGAWLADQSIRLSGGALKGATSLGGSVLQMAADPVDTVKGLEGMAEHVSVIPGMPNPLKMAHGLYNAATTDATLGDEMNRSMNPLASAQDDAKYWGQVAHGFAQPYAKDWNKGNYADVAGRAGFDVASLFFGAGEANAAMKGAEAATLAGDASRAGQLADAARAGQLADAAKAGDVANVASHTSEGVKAADAARASSEASDAARASSESSEAARGGGGGGQSAGGSGGGGGGGRRGPARSEADRIADEVEREGRRTRADDVRANAREIEKRAIKEDVESGIRRPETEALEHDIGRDNVVDLAEGEAGLKDVGAEVHHKTSLGEAPELGEVPENLEALGKKAHREGAHGRDFGKQRGGGVADKDFDVHEPLQSAGRKRGEPPLSSGELDRAADAGAAEGWADRENAINDAIDRSRDPAAVEKAANAGKAPGKGRGGSTLSAEEQAAREAAKQDKGIAKDYGGSDIPDWMRRAGVDPKQWEDALKWVEDLI